MKLLTKLKEMITREADHLTVAVLPDPGSDLEVLTPGKTYLRVWVTDMYLTHDREWFKTQMPSVNASVELRFADRPAMKFGKITRAPEEAVAKGAFNDFPISDLMPYHGGLVNISASLFTIKGANELGATIDILQGFSGLVAAPLGQVLTIADKVNSGIDQFLDVVDGNVQLIYERTFKSQGGGGENILKPCYIAVIAKPLGSIDPANLSVRESKLYHTEGGVDKPYNQEDYMLLHIESRKERDDWQRLTDIDTSRSKAINAILLGEQEKAKALKRSTIVAVYESDDLVQHDKTRIGKVIRDEFRDLEDGGLGAAAEAEMGLNELVEARAESVDQAEAAPASLEDILADMD